MASIASTTTGLGGMALRGLGNGHVLIDARRVVALSAVMVASTAIGHVKVSALISREVGTVEDGSGGFWSVRMRCVALRVC